MSDRLLIGVLLTGLLIVGTVVLAILAALALVTMPFFVLFGRNF